MLTVNIQADVRRCAGMLQTAAERQLPFVLAVTVNNLAFEAQRAEGLHMQQVFKHPRPFTARSTLVDQATKSNPTATIFVRPEVAKYLAPYEFGGLHVLPGPVLLNPRAIPLDAYGQLPYRTMARLRGRKDIFIGRIKTKHGEISGVWQRLSVNRAGNARRVRLAGGGVYDPQHGALKLLIRFGRAVPVTQHLNFVATATSLIKARFRPAFQAAIDRALASSRP